MNETFHNRNKAAYDIRQGHVKPKNREASPTGCWTGPLDDVIHRPEAPSRDRGAT